MDQCRHRDSRQHAQQAAPKHAQQSLASSPVLSRYRRSSLPQLSYPCLQGPLLQPPPPWYPPPLQPPPWQPPPPQPPLLYPLFYITLDIHKGCYTDYSYNNYIVLLSAVGSQTTLRCWLAVLRSFILYQLFRTNMNIARKLIVGTLATGMAYNSAEQNEQCFIYRDDIGAHWGIKGYEEQVTEVGSHHGHLSWPQFRSWGTYDSGSVRRGFQVFSKNCANCHGIMGKKYDLLLDKVYEQLELSSWVAQHFTIHPAHHHYKQFYYQEWDERDRYIHDHIYAPYYSQDQAKNANQGVWPVDFTKIRMRPGGINYIYNIMTGYHFKAPYGMEVPKGKHFNPYFDHMIIGMPRQLHDGLIEFEDGTPASTPQMANDVSNFIFFLQRRSGWRRNDKKVRQTMVFIGCLMLLPISYMKTYGYFRSLLCTRTETYAVRDGLGYKHWKTGMKSIKAPHYKGSYWT